MQSLPRSSSIPTLKRSSRKAAYFTEVPYQGWRRLRRIDTLSCTLPASARPLRSCSQSRLLFHPWTLTSAFLLLPFPGSFQLDIPSLNRLFSICAPQNQSSFSLSSLSNIFYLSLYAISPHSSHFPSTGSSTSSWQTTSQPLSSSSLLCW